MTWCTLSTPLKRQISMQYTQLLLFSFVCVHGDEQLQLGGCIGGGASFYLYQLIQINSYSQPTGVWVVVPIKGHVLHGPYSMNIIIYMAIKFTQLSMELQAFKHACRSVCVQQKSAEVPQILVNKHIWIYSTYYLISTYSTVGRKYSLISALSN